MEGLKEGLNLTVFGMGFVLLFLLLLIAAMNLMSALLLRLQKPVAKATPAQSAEKTTLPADEDLTQLLPVISAVVHHHHQQTQRQS